LTCTGYDETMEMLDELVRAGKVRVLGCSNETSYGLMKSLATSDRLGTARYHTIQNNYSINNRRFEDELKQVCRLEGVSLLPYSPLGGGVLSGKYLDGARPEGARFSRYLEMEGARQFDMAQRFAGPRALESTARIVAIAKEAGLPPVTLATAWSKQNDFVASTIVGVSREDQLDEIFAAIDLKLSAEVMTAVHRVTKEILYPMG
jgi:aryl-alcohol dehydrogenase-like predicted oxidoreductase